MKVASFDIFDTTLVRKCGQPENIFYLLSKRVYPRDAALQNALFLWRKSAERKAMLRLNTDNLTLEDIYTEFDNHSFPELKAEELKRLEVELEMSELVSVGATKELIDRKRSEGYVIVFISDMYLPSEALKRKLIAEGCAVDSDRLFVSCEWDANKRNGKLYDVVRERLGDVSRWEHYGDNVRSDYKQARKKGIRSTLIKTDYTEAEQQVMDAVKYSPLSFDGAVVVGNQRAARLNSFSMTTDTCHATDFVASLYIPYVKFVLQKASEAGLKRLYFLSRDGYILKEIAETMQSAYPNIELRYLFVSRYSLFLPSLYSLEKEEVFESKGTSSFWRVRMKVADILHYLRTTPQELGDTFCHRVSFDKFRSQAQEELFFETLQIPEIKAKILSKAATERDLLVRYFRDEGLFDGTPAATVDVGWIGTSRLMINRILEREAGESPQVGFYFGCHPECLPPRYGKLYSYCSYNLCTTQVVTLMEHYYSASPYASTVGYKEEAGKVIPVFKDAHSVQWPEITDANWKMAKRVSCYLQAYPYLDLSAFMVVWGNQYLRCFLEMLCPLDYSTFYKLGTFDDVTSNSVLLKRVSPFRLLCYLFKGKIKGCVFPRQSIYYTYGFKPCRPEQSLRERWRNKFKRR